MVQHEGINQRETERYAKDLKSTLKDRTKDMSSLAGSTKSIIGKIKGIQEKIQFMKSRDLDMSPEIPISLSIPASNVATTSPS